MELIFRPTSLLQSILVAFSAPVVSESILSLAHPQAFPDGKRADEIGRSVGYDYEAARSGLPDFAISPISVPPRLLQTIDQERSNVELPP